MSQQKCPDGRYSLGGASSCLICPAGRSCINGSDPISPTECHRGTYSPPGVGICHACPLGTYSNTGASFCSPCPAGHSCNDPSQTPVACTSSEYWNNGGEVSSLKLLKFLKAETGTNSSSNISLGFWLLHVFQHTQNKWLGFDLGYNKRLRISYTILLQHLLRRACVTVVYFAMLFCCISCLSGCTSQIPRCAPCPAGYSCTNVTQPPVPCMPGYYSLQGNALCTECEAGQACTDPAQAPKHCPVGTYSQKVSSY